MNTNMDFLYMKKREIEDEIKRLEESLLSLPHTTFLGIMGLKSMIRAAKKDLAKIEKMIEEEEKN